jgi:GNAT superfamily N-acetyltransferase
VDNPHPLEANLWAMHLDFHRLGSATVHDDPDLLWYTVPGTNSWLNGASRCDLSGNVDERIGEVVAAAESLRMALMWHQTPSSRPADLGTKLEQHGFEASEEPGMILALDRFFEPPPAGLSITAVTDQAGVLEWVNTFDRAFGGEPRGNSHPWLAAFGQLYLNAASPGRLFIGRVDGVAVGTSLAFVSRDVVGLYGVGTAPENRGRGYGGAMTVAGIKWGRRRGATLGVLESSDAGFRVYQRLGFRTVCETTAWVRPAD